MKRRFSLFTYPVMDMKAAEAELNRRAAAGWRLERIWLDGLACFVPAEEPVCYCLDWCDPVLAADAPDYRALLEEAGWTRRALVGSWAVYEAPAGATPIQTDSALEYQRFRRKVLRRMLIGGGGLAALALLLAALVLWVYGGRLSWEDMAGAMAFSSLGAPLLLPLPLLLAAGVLWLGRMVLRLCQWKRAVREGERGRRSSRSSAPVPSARRWPTPRSCAARRAPTTGRCRCPISCATCCSVRDGPVRPRLRVGPPASAGSR